MVPVINSDQMRQEEKINAGYFQITKRNVKHFFFQISWYLRPNINFKLSVNCVRNNNCFEFILRMFFAWHEHFAGVLFLRMETIRALWEKIISVPIWLTVSSAWGRIFNWKDRKEGRKEIDNLHFLLFPFFLFVFVFQYSNFCIVLQREGKKLVGH